jgi:DNA-binding NarL/FixJ family response regulator
MSVAQKSYRVLVVDDHAVVRSGLKHLLEEQPGVEVCSEATTGVEAVENVKKAKPDMVLLDLTMPDMNGLDAARQIREISPNTDILVLSMHYTEEIRREHGVGDGY